MTEQSSDVDPSGSDCDLRETHISFAERFHNNITALHMLGPGTLVRIVRLGPKY